MEPVIAVNAYALGAFVTYLVAVLGIGVYAARFSSAGLTEFFLAGRRLNRFVVALSAVVSGRSAWLLLGLTGMAWSRGVGALWAAVGYIVAELMLFLWYAPRLRRFTGTYDCITLPDFFAARFDDRDGRLRILLSAIMLVFMVGYVAAQFVGGGKAIGASFGLQPETGIFITALLVLGYTILGGFLAVSLTDTLQGILMLGALVALPLMTISALGGWTPVLAELRALDAGMLDPFAVGLGALIAWVGIGLGSPGNPHILVRYMSINDAAQLRFAAVVGTAWNVVMAAGAVLIGLAGRVYFPEASMLPGADPESLYPALAEAHLPPVLFGAVVASIFAAIMSTADSQLLVATSSVVRDVYEKVLRRGEPLPPRRLVLYSRILVVLLVAAALGFGLLAENIVFWLTLFAWAGLGAALGPTSILALYWRGTTRAGVAAGAITGAVTTIAWYLSPLRSVMYELIPGFTAGLVATIVVSRLTRPPADTDAMFSAMVEADRGRSPRP
ncbi:MAG TPA: sodium/proline symporter [Longimicrobiales bacterium]|nr:sodium/proline symporter [Longimicrobiales bacterium]